MMQKIYVLHLEDLYLLHEIEMGPNAMGLCEFSLSGSRMVLVCTGYDKGEVRVEVLDLDEICWRTLIEAHNSDVASVALSNDRRLLATVSTEGTLVRVFKTSDGRLLQELRRGFDEAEIYSLCFSSDSEWLVVSSNKGTIHVFRLNMGPRSIGTDGSQETEQNNSPLSRVPSFRGSVLPNNRSAESSVAQFHVQEDIQHIFAFGHEKNTVLIVGMNGRFYICKFDPIEGGEMTQMQCHNFLQLELKS
ncbi:UNVERIFIED_CONTAM: Autophagy-related protein 18a [Sesamum radiatum]|uniref:Autophagy-related protein 18a n=1 Tax=Sesamum radiatum TaxID=300843 RepID=A0AAW2U831_SESRA